MSEKGISQGSIYYDKTKKRWIAQYYEYNIELDKRVKKTKNLKSEEDAKKYIKTIMYQKENPIYIENNGIPLNELMRSNLKLKYDSNQITSAQYGRVLRTIEKIEKLNFGKKNIDDITSDELQLYMNSVKNLSNSSISKIYQQFNQAFKLAINKGYLMRNPMITVIKPRSDKEDKVVRALTVDEQQNFTNYLTSKTISECKYKNVFLIQMYMGLRIGEALALSMSDIDLKNKRMNVHRTLTNDENGAILMGTTTKTYAGKRILPIPDYLMPNILEQMRHANNQENNEEKLLFKPEINRYSNRINVNSELKRLLKLYFGITGISTHSLRHSYGTRCIESGMAPVVVQRLMGHTDITITLNTYTDVLDKFKESEIDKVNQYYLNENLINSNNPIKLDDFEEFENTDDNKNIDR